MKKKLTQIEDFLSDTSFKEWVLSDSNFRSIYWDNWIKNNPDKLDLMLEAKEIILALNDNVDDWQEERQDETFSKLMNTINNQENVNEIPHKKLEKGASIPTQISKITWSYIKKASVVILILGVSAVLYGVLNTDIRTNKHISEVSEYNYNVKTTHLGEKKRVQLSDGTTIFMNSATELRIREGFGKTHRDIELNGESFFDVAPNKDLPFRVVSGNMTTVALGTSFNIKSYSEDFSTEVKLVTGKVSVENRNQQGLNDMVYLIPGEAIILTENDFKKAQFDLTKADLWVHGILLFEKAPFPDVITDLERWYGVEISVSGKTNYKNSYVSGEFKRDNLENVLHSIGYSLDFDFDIQDKKVEIYFHN